MCCSVLEGMTVSESLYLVLYHVSSEIVMVGAVHVVALYAVTPCKLVHGRWRYGATCYRFNGVNTQTSYIGTLQKCLYETA